MVCPTAEPLIGRWPILQALALGADVVAHRHAAAGLSPCVENASLHLTDGSDWADLCIEMLRAPRRAVAPPAVPAAALLPQVLPTRALFLATAPRAKSHEPPALARAA